MGSTVLETCDKYEYLGIVLDNKLTLEKNISKTVSSASSRCYMLGKMRRNMSKPTAILIYKQTILPVLEYCGFLFNSVVQMQHKRLQQVQNRCLRICLNVKMRYPVSKLHIDTSMDYLYVRYNMQLLLMIYRYMYGGDLYAKDYGLEFQDPINTGRVTRAMNTGLLKYPSCNKLGYNVLCTVVWIYGIP